MPDPTRKNGREKPRCGLTRKDGKPCRNPAVADLEVCARHLRERATLIKLSGGLDLEVPDLGES